MPVFNIEAPDGHIVKVEGPEGATQEQAISYAQSIYTPKEVPEQTWGEALVTNPLASLGTGVGRLAQLPGQIGQLAGVVGPEDTNTGLMGVGKELEKFSESKKSQRLQHKQQMYNEQVDAQEGFLNQASAAIAGVVSDPNLLSSFLFEQVPNLVGSMGTGMLARGAVKLAMREATEVALEKAAVRGAVGGGAVMQGADVGSDTYQQVYERLIKEGADPTTANEKALAAGRESAIVSATTSVLSTKLPGGTTVERAMVGRGLPRTGGVIRGLAGEAAQEGVEEGTGQLASNYAQQQIFPDVDLMQGVGKATGLGALMGGAFGGVGGATLRPQKPLEEDTAPKLKVPEGFEVPQQPAVEPMPAEPYQPNQPETPLSLEDRAFKPVVFPDGTVGYTQEQVDQYRETLFMQQFDPELQFAQQNAAKAQETAPAMPALAAPVQYVTPDGTVIQNLQERQSADQAEFEKNYPPAAQSWVKITPEDVSVATEGLSEGTKKTANNKWFKDNVFGKTDAEVRSLVNSNPSLVEGDGHRAKILRNLLGREVLSTEGTGQINEEPLKIVNPKIATELVNRAEEGDENARYLLKQMGAEYNPDFAKHAQSVREDLVPALERFGLGNIGLRLMDSIENGRADGYFAKNIIGIALDSANPMQALRHESIHALKEMDAFTPQEWEFLQDNAYSKWINEFFTPETQQAYYEHFLSENGGNPEGFAPYMAEEAIAEAFKNYPKSRFPSGAEKSMYEKIKALFDKLKEFFKGKQLKVEDIFTGIEQGRFAPGQKFARAPEVRFSLRSDAVAKVAGIENSFNEARSQDFPTNRDLKLFMQDNVRSAAQEEDVNLEDKEYLVNVGTKDAIYALKSNANAVGWYDTTVTKAMNILATIHPEIATDPDARFAFTWALAVTSNGMKVDKNFELAELVYNQYKQTGVMPTNLQAGQAQKAINDGLDLFNTLVDRFGIDDLRLFMADKFKVSQIERVTGVDVGGEFADTEVRGAAILGPKIGNGFFSNLNGHFDQLTMDRWLMRTWGRWSGSLINIRQDMIAQKQEELSNLINEMQKDQQAAAIYQDLIRMPFGSDLNALSKAINKASMKPENREIMNSTKVGEDIRKTGNALFKYLDGQKEAPDGPAERNYIRSVFADILANVRADGNEEMTMSDLQALLWYPEKRLYDIAKESETTEGYEDDEAPDYANAAAKLALSLGVPQQEIENAARIGTGTTGRSAGVSAEEGSEYGTSFVSQGFASRQRNEFLTRGVVRSYRGSNAAKPRAYKGKSGGDGKRVRILGEMVGTVAEFSPERKFANALSSIDLNAPKMIEVSPEAGSAVFSKAITAAKKASPWGASVYVYPTEDYKNMRLFVTKEGDAGFAIKKDGDIVSVFSQRKGAATGMLQLAIDEGGRKLDAFNTVLPQLYAANGFEAVGRMKWNDEYKPEGWSKQMFQDFNDGNPDVVFMVYNPEFASSTSEEYFESYDEAAAVQNAFVEADKKAAKDAEESVLKTAETFNSPGESVKFSLRTKPDPVKTVKAYKLFRVKPNHPGQLFPLFIGKNDPVQIGVWFDADAIPTKNFAPRPGWHAGSLPMATHIGGKSQKGLNAPDIRKTTEVWAECEMPADVDWQEEANRRGINKQGKLIASKAEIKDEIPADGYYSYKTNPNMTGSWLIGGALKVNRILSDAEVESINREGGGKDLPRQEPFDFKKYGFEEPGKKFSFRQDESAIFGEQRTKNFENWFKKSTITNEEGKPRFMYHGTARDIEEFIPKQAGAIFLTDSPRFAEDFTETSADYMTDELFKSLPEIEKRKLINLAVRSLVKEGSITKQAGKDLLEKYKDNLDRAYISLSQVLSPILRERLPSMPNVMPLYVRAENPFDYDNPKNLVELARQIAVNREEQGIDTPDRQAFIKHTANKLSAGSWELIEEEEIQKAIKDAGFDSFYVKEAGVKNLGVYSPNQVKAAFGNIGRFDSSNKIRYSFNGQQINRLTKTSDQKTIGKRIIDSINGTFDSVQDQGKRTEFRVKFVDVSAGLQHTLRNLPIFDQSGKMRADFLAHAKMQVMNLISNGFKTGVPTVSKDGSLVIKKSSNNMENAERIADAIDSHPIAAQTGLSGRDLVAEVARILRGKEIMEEDAQLRKDGFQKLRRADALAALAKQLGLQGKQSEATRLRKKAEKLRRKGNELLTTNREKQVTAAHIAYAEHIYNNVPQVREVLDIWREMNHSLVRLWKDVGLLDDAKANEYLGKKSYVPLFKAAEDLDENAAFGFRGGVGAKSTPKIKQLQGSEAIRNVWENVAKQYAKMTTLAYENQTRSAAAEQMIAAGSARTTFKKDDNANLSFRVDGKEIHIIADNPLDVAAFQALSYEFGPIMNAFKGTTKYLRYGALINPVFWIKQLIRDPIHASFVTGSIVTPAHAAAEWGKILANRSDEYNILAAHGVVGEVGNTWTPQEYIEQVGKTLGTKRTKAGKLWDNIKHVHETSDAATRVAIYKSAYKEGKAKGMSNEDAQNFAVYKAREAINFAVRGNSKIISSMNAFIPFFSAQIVSLDTVYKAMTGHGLNKADAAELRKWFWSGAALTGMSSILYALSMLSFGDDYDDIPDYEKDNNWLIPIGADSNGRMQFAKVPVPFEIGYMFKTLPEVAIRTSMGNSTLGEGFKSIIDGLKHNIPGASSLYVPHAVSPIAEAVTNYSVFKGGPIEGRADQGLPTEMRGQDRASAFGKFVSQDMGASNIGVSPAIADHLVSGYLAQWGTFFLGLTDTLADAAGDVEKPSKDFTQLPGLKSFTTNPDVNRAVSTFYDIHGQASQVAAEFNKYVQSGEAEKIDKLLEDPKKSKLYMAHNSLNKIADSITDINKTIRLIEQSTEYTSDQKRDMISYYKSVKADLSKVAIQLSKDMGIR